MKSEEKTIKNGFLKFWSLCLTFNLYKNYKPDNKNFYINFLFKSLIFILSLFLSITFGGFFTFFPTLILIVIYISEPTINRIYYLFFSIIFVAQIPYFSFSLVVFLLLYVLKYLQDLFNKKIKLNLIYSIIFALLCLYVALPIGVFNVKMTFTILFCISVIYLILTYSSQINFKRLSISFASSVLISFILSIFFLVIPNVSNINVLISAGNIYRFLGLSTDPNFFSAFIVMAFGMSALLFLKKEIHWITFWISCVVFFVLTLLTISKMAFIMFLVIFISTLFCFLFKKEFKMRDKIIKTLITLLVLLLVGFVFHPYFKILFGRFDFPELQNVQTEVNDDDYNIDRIEPSGNLTEKEKQIANLTVPEEKLDFQNKILNSTLGKFLSKFSTYRFNLWIGYLSIMLLDSLNFVFGFGEVRVRPQITIDGLGGYRDTHNTYLDVIFSYGIIFFLILICLFIYFIVINIIRKKINYEAIPIFLVSGLVLMSLNFMFTPQIIIMLGVPLLAFLYKKNNTSKQNEGKLGPTRKKILLVNSVCGVGSTGKICVDIARLAKEKGYDCKIAFGRGQAKGWDDVYKIESSFGNKLHYLKSKFFDKHGLGSRRATKKFVNFIKEYNPDVIHLHNIHGYYLNYKILFEFLKTYQGKIIWTMHDMWPITGHCAYPYECEKWQSGCEKCQFKRDYPIAIADNSKGNYKLKKDLFASLKNLTIITPSNWLANEFKKSFLNKFEIKVINNGLDLSVFKPEKSNFKEKYDLQNKKIILGVASVWEKRKGLDDFVKLSGLISDDYRIVLVGVSKEQKQTLPENILAIEKTENQKELAQIYSAADIFVNFTYSDISSMVNMEALACGTPVVCYKTGGAIEMLNETTGAIVKQGDVEGAWEVVKITQKNKELENDCTKHALKFDKNTLFLDYIKEYDRK